jgi:hypothetical protein
MLDVLFVGLVVLDGFITQKLLAVGGTELSPNPFALWSAGHLWARIIVAIVIVLSLRFFDKWKLLIPLCLLSLGICIYNAIMLAVGNAAILGLAMFP